MATKTWAKGTIIRLGGNPIAFVRNIKGPGMSRKTFDVTTHDSAGDYGEFIAGVRDGGDLSFDIIFDPTDVSHGTPTTGLLGQFNDSGSAGSWDVMFPVGTAGSPGFSFLGEITGLSPAAPVDDALSASVTIKVSGEPLYSAAIS